MTEDTPQPFYTPLSQNPDQPTKDQPANNAQPSSLSSPQATSSQATSSSTMTSAPAHGTFDPAKTPHFSEDAAAHPIITQFTSLYHGALTNVKAGSLDLARQQYNDMLKLYQQITALPTLREMNKDIAHFCLQDVYDALARNTDPTVSRLTFGALLGVTILLLVIGGIIATHPAIVGLFTGLSTAGIAHPVWIGGDQAVLISGPTTLHVTDLFATSDKAPLTFVTTSSDILDAVVSGDYATLIPKYGASGTTRITLIAAREDHPSVMTNVPIDVTIAPAS